MRKPSVRCTKELMRLSAHTSGFIKMLDELRTGNMTKETVNVFKNLSRPIDWGDGIEPTHLYVAAARAGRS